MPLHTKNVITYTKIPDITDDTIFFGYLFSRSPIAKRVSLNELKRSVIILISLGGGIEKPESMRSKNSLNLCIYVARKKVRNSVTFLIDFWGQGVQPIDPILKLIHPRYHWGAPLPRADSGR